MTLFFFLTSLCMLRSSAIPHTGSHFSIFPKVLGLSPLHPFRSIQIRMSSETSVKQPPWRQPEGQGKVNVFNSLTRSKVPLVPKNGNTLKWYICGPTVYDAAHLGHARTYLSFDIIRRILKDYFKYNISFCMNITDIDDKIIIRAREQNVPFTDLSRKWETSFMEDMKALKVLPPDVLTRVSEYVPEIINFVKKIIDNGFAYESNGSVYFDTKAFSASHNYAKLEPWAVGDVKLFAEGEGSLSVGVADKRAPNDFALWKKSKEGEPHWDSPWGTGRPGWHIECSAMAGDILGETLDIHTGGEDLKFPHHDNELAQSEAYFNNDQWVNYFIHSGHLHISGCKMSKSLKNFITIQEALQTYTAKQIRFFFLMHKYEATMDYSSKGLTHACEVEKTFTEFFHAVKAVVRYNDDKAIQKWSETEKTLADALYQTKDKVHESLVDNFNTPAAMLALGDLVRRANIYIAQQKEKNESPRAHLLTAIAEHITDIFKVFGLIDTQEIGFPTAGADTNVEQVLSPFLDAITDFRESVRNAARAKDHGAVLGACDKVRDETLPLLGVRLDDSNSGAIWKLGNKEELAKEVEQKRKAEQAKAEAKLEAQKREQEKLEKAKIPPSEWFRAMKDKERFSEFDETGFPTKDVEGKELTKSAVKNVRKEYDAQAKAHQKYLDSIKPK